MTDSNEPVPVNASALSRGGPAERTITRIVIHAFRGIPGLVAVDLPPVGRVASSLLVLGDNGSGKSSIVDGLQFGLQCEIRGERGQRAVALARSKATEALPDVRITLSDGTEVRRVVSWEEREGGTPLARVDTSAASDFAKTPLVLRRADILRFWETPPDQRQLVFLRYFKPGSVASLELPQDRVARLRGDKGRATAARRDAIRSLADVAHLSPAQIPLDADGFNRWVNREFFGGFDRTASRVRVRRRLPPPIWIAIEEVRSSIKSVRAVERDLNLAKKAAPINDNEDLTRVLLSASERLTAAFQAISPRAPVDEVRLGAGRVDFRIVGAFRAPHKRRDGDRP